MELPQLLYHHQTGEPRFIVQDWLNTPGILGKTALTNLSEQPYFNSTESADWLGDKHIKLWHGHVPNAKNRKYACTSKGRVFTNAFAVEDILSNEVVWDITWTVKGLPKEMRDTDVWRHHSGNARSCRIYAPYQAGLRLDAKELVKEMAKHAVWTPSGKGTYTKKGYWQWGQ